MPNKTTGLTAQKLRILLSVGILAWVIVAGVVFWLFHGQLTDYAHDVKQSKAEADTSTQNLQALQQLEEQLKENKENVDRTKSIVAESRHYQYQDQIIRDINKYAAASNIKVAGYTFTDSNATGGEAAPATATTAEGASAPAEGADTNTPLGEIKTTSVSIALSEEVSYEAIMKFVRSIEQNLTKMQLAGISLTYSGESKKIASNALTIEVYVR